MGTAGPGTEPSRRTCGPPDGVPTAPCLPCYRRKLLPTAPGRSATQGALGRSTKRRCVNRASRRARKSSTEDTDQGVPLVESDKARVVYRLLCPNPGALQETRQLGGRRKPSPPTPCFFFGFHDVDPRRS
eukprot:6056606-Pyramimonas_sp.AAC.1